MEWTDELIARLRVLWEEGHSTAVIGRSIGMSKNAVVGKAHRLNLPARPSPIRREPGAHPPRPRPLARGPTLPPLGLARLDGAREATVGRPPLLPATMGLPRPAAGEKAGAERASVVAGTGASSRPQGREMACCWPLGEPGAEGFHFCGDAALPGKPYCAAHAQLAYVRVRERREDAA